MMKYTKGFTIPELLISLVINLIILHVMFQIYVSTLKIYQRIEAQRGLRHKSVLVTAHLREDISHAIKIDGISSDSKFKLIGNKAHLYYLSKDKLLVQDESGHIDKIADGIPTMSVIFYRNTNGKLVQYMPGEKVNERSLVGVGINLEFAEKESKFPVYIYAAWLHSSCGDGANSDHDCHEY